jgi:hypothetical protein
MAEARTSIKIQPDLTDLRELLKALNAMDKDSQKALKDEVYSISAWTAQRIQAAAVGHPYMPLQAAIIAPTVRASRDRLPTVLIGGSKGRASGGANAGQLLFGNEFGGDRNAFGNLTAFANGGYRFARRSAPVGRGNAGYWIFPTLKGAQSDITQQWTNAVEKVYDNWKRGI